MAKFKVTFNNTAGVLDEKVVESGDDAEGGLSFAKFTLAVVDMLIEGPVHDGDSFTIELVEEATP